MTRPELLGTGLAMIGIGATVAYSGEPIVGLVIAIAGVAVVLAPATGRDTPPRPLLILEFPEMNLGAADSAHWMFLRNVNPGTVTDVRVAPIENGEYRARFDDIQTIQPDQTAPLLCEVQPLGAVFARHVQGFTTLMGAGARDLQSRFNVTISVSFTDSKGGRHTIPQTIHYEQASSTVLGVSSAWRCTVGPPQRLTP